MLALYEEHARQIIEVCPTLEELDCPSVEQCKKLSEIQEHCLKWCIQEWTYAYLEASRQLTKKFDALEPEGYNVLV